MTNQPPWASGPAEILRHGLELLKKDSDTNRRLAMISIDNAVELMMKTYLGLPKRVTGLNIKRIEYQDFSESFPKLLNAIEKYASAKLDGIDLGEVEWYHRLRNQLYHQGNGLTVERDKVEIYAELANLLFTNLFGGRLVETENDTMILGEFMQSWVNFEKTLAEIVDALGLNPQKRPVIHIKFIDMLAKEGILSKFELEEIHQLRKIRNDIVHGVANHNDVLKPEMAQRLTSLSRELRNRLGRMEHVIKHGAIIQLKCIKTDKEDFCLLGIPTDQPYGNVYLTNDSNDPHTWWKIMKLENGLYAFENLGGTEAFRWLDGMTKEGTVSLVPEVNERYNGARWEIFEISKGIYTIKCMGIEEGFRWLAGDINNKTVSLVLEEHEETWSMKWRIVGKCK